MLYRWSCCSTWLRAVPQVPLRLTRYAARRWCPAAAARRRAARWRAARPRAAAARPARPTGSRRSARRDAVGRPVPRSKASTPSGRGRQLIGASPNAGSARRMRSASRYSAEHRVGAAPPRPRRSGRAIPSAAAATARPPRRAGEKPNGGSVPDHGSGTRRRPGRGRRRPCATRSGPGAARRGCPAPPTGRVPRPGRCRPSRAAPSSAAPPPGPGGCRAAGRPGSCGSTAAAPGLNEVSARPYLDTTRSTSWLDSTQVAGAPSGAFSASVSSMTWRSAAASHGQFRYGKLNTVCSSPGPTYRASRAASGSQTSPISTRAGRTRRRRARQDR